MLRFAIPAFALTLIMPCGAQAASKQNFELDQMLEKVAKESSVGTPRAISEDVLDQGFTAENGQLINHLSVREDLAKNMSANPKDTRSQLAKSVCSNKGFLNLMSKGAVLKYQFSEYQTNRPIATQTFKSSDCAQPAAKAGKK